MGQLVQLAIATELQADRAYMYIYGAVCVSSHASKGKKQEKPASKAASSSKAPPTAAPEVAQEVVGGKRNRKAPSRY